MSGEPIRAGDTIYQSQLSIRNPSTYGSYGAGFGDTITDLDREFLAQREPISRFFVYYMAGDVFKNWFELDDPRTEGKDEEFDRKVQKRLREIDAPEQLRRALEWERLYGVSYIVGRFDDAKTIQDLMQEKPAGAKVEKIYAYKRSAVTAVLKDENPNSDRYGEPLLYNINRGEGYIANRFYVHWSRVLKVQTTSDAVSVIDIIYDDQVSYRNIRWGLAQTIWRVGSGFPVLTLNNYTPEMLAEAKEKNLFGNLMARTYGLLNQDMTLKFEGAQQSALNPGPYVDPLVKNISAGTRVPRPVLEGTAAGALTGSEVNLLDYWSAIATIQKAVEPFARQVINWVLVGDKFEVQDYDVDWPTGYEPTPAEQSRMDYEAEQSNTLKLNYKSFDEVRAENGLPPLGATKENPDGDGSGNVVPGLEKLKQPQANPFGGPSAGANPGPGFPSGKTLFDADEVNGQVQNHDYFVRDLQRKLRAIIDEVISGGLHREDAMANAQVVIKRQLALEEANIIGLMERKLKRNLYSLPVEGRAELDRRYQKYMDAFAAILEDALRLAGKVSPT